MPILWQVPNPRGLPPEIDHFLLSAGVDDDDNRVRPGTDGLVVDDQARRHHLHPEPAQRHARQPIASSGVGNDARDADRPAGSRVPETRPRGLPPPGSRRSWSRCPRSPRACRSARGGRHRATGRRRRRPPSPARAGRRSAIRSIDHGDLDGSSMLSAYRPGARLANVNAPSSATGADRRFDPLIAVGTAPNGCYANFDAGCRRTVFDRHASAHRPARRERQRELDPVRSDHRSAARPTDLHRRALRLAPRRTRSPRILRTAGRRCETARRPSESLSSECDRERRTRPAGPGPADRRHASAAPRPCRPARGELDVDVVDHVAFVDPHGRGVLRLDRSREVGLNEAELSIAPVRAKRSRISGFERVARRRCTRRAAGS